MTKKPGRPKIKMDSEQVENLAEFGCTTLEIAKFFKCDESTVRKRYKEEMSSGREKMKINLRQIQFKLATTNAAMSIFLGKNYLAQTDRQSIDLTGNLETVLKECGYEESDIGAETNPEQEEILEHNTIQANA
jgi:AraC-like DNA-binding protein|tara:strand:+ start:385 stop:783 length:399 start_codon:yes stop_codon:yes gene_type:complete